ncbi:MULTISPECIES: hypothetical protein [Acinetobacter]|jgi:hypothetical protein|uniref:hypothetical protein n=1 Tax=Acinetobacter TaxID=469 RepID=UPI0007E9B180|nr:MULTISPECIES: hypothetical protein [Acinetobacter]EKT9248033.1 hypothetical protein [Acinetobacter baumannii]EKV8039628.1 hypothetical protein [Acinetobacter baumannii]MBE2308782.1 hypothetical protein [Acinetobacter baumannii]MBE2623472.1 hypothetical protein [Acinetobacter baumannii]MBE2653591.1 hypothetical protein [Acinetobacter baumannii]
MAKIFAFILAIAFCTESYCATGEVNSLRENSDCKKMANFAVSKHDEYAHGKSIQEMIDQENNSQDQVHQKQYKTLVIEILDTFAVWDDPAEKKRVDEEIRDHFFSICDPGRVKGIF